jgi:predicted transcriptional regulator
MIADDICERNHQGDELSTLAHAGTNKSRDRMRVMMYLADPRGATCDEVEIALGLAHQTCSARISELKRDGLLDPVAKRPTRTGSMAQAWKLKGGVQ